MSVWAGDGICLFEAFETCVMDGLMGLTVTVKSEASASRSTFSILSEGIKDQRRRGSSSTRGQEKEKEKEKPLSAAAFLYQYIRTHGQDMGTYIVSQVQSLTQYARTHVHT